MRILWIVLLAAGSVLGQQRVQISAVGRVGANLDDRLPAILDRLSQLTLGPLSDTMAKSMLAASVAGSAQFLRWHLEELIGATTLTDHETDVLVAHWASTGNDVARTDVWLWDDPIGCFFLLPFPMEAMNDRPRLEKLFESIWIWWEPDPAPEPPDPANPNRPRTPQRIRLNDPRTRIFRLRLALPPPEGLFGTGGAEGDPGFERPRPGRGRPEVKLYRRGGQVWVAIRLGKPWMETPDGMYEIAERFPPLRERVSGWSLNRLLYEYGRPLINDWLVGTTERDRIILAELLRRDLAVYQLRQLLDRTPTNGNLSGAEQSRTYEGGMVTGVVVSAGKSKQFETVLREEIVRARQNPTEVLGNMLRSLLPAMDVDASDLAVECVGLEQYSSMQALRYLEARAQTVSVYNALRERIVPKELLADKQRVLSTIQKRLR